MIADIELGGYGRDAVRNHVATVSQYAFQVAAYLFAGLDIGSSSGPIVDTDQPIVAGPHRNPAFDFRD